jgi:diguanylate cyclase (GGDEF)-like protein
MDRESSADDGLSALADGGALADRHADQVAELHRVASLAPGDPDERLGELLDAGCRVLEMARGFVLVRSGSELSVRVRGGADAEGPVVGALVADRRLDEVLSRQATLAVLGGVGSTHDESVLGAGALVACPLWVTGRVAGVIAFVDGDDHDLFSAWELTLVDLVADGASRILEHEADIRSLVRLESRAQAVIDLMPDPVVRLREDGQQLSDDGDEVLGPFDPTAAIREPDAEPDPAVLERVCHSVTAALVTGRLQTDVFAAGPGPDARRVEARFVPAEGDEVLCIVRDVTERHRAEQALAEQVAFEALVASISTRLIGCAPQMLDEAIETGLGEIAAFFGADRAFIDELAPDGASLRVSHLWTRHNVISSRVKGQKVDVKGFGWLTARFERAGHVFVRGRANLPVEATEQSLADPDDKGVLWVRLGYGGELVGVLGLTWRTHEPPPSDEVLGLVRFAADAFLGALRRRSVALLADGQAEVFELIARGAPVATALLAARALLERHTLGATVVIATVEDDGRLVLVTEPGEQGRPEADWFAALEPGLANPFGQAVITGEPVMVANAFGDPRFAEPVLPEERFWSATIIPVRSPRNGSTLAVVALLGDEPGAPIARAAVRDSVLSLVTVAVERSVDERRLAHQATHDPLTGVGNRAALVDRLELALARARRSGRAVAVLFCDLDGFKAVNDRFGHDRGDHLLVEVAERIDRAVRPSDTVCRTGGDEFVIVCEDLTDEDQAYAIGERVRATIEGDPVDVGEAQLPVRVSVGVAIAEVAVDDPDRLLRAADLAMYARKQQRANDRPPADSPAPGTSRPPEAEHGAAAASGRLQGGPGSVATSGRRDDPFGRDLTEAIEGDGLRLVHQPLVRRDGTVAGMESLVRWDHPTLGPVGAERILAAAAQEDLAGPLGRWIRRRALVARRRWSASLDAPVPVHVNVSGTELCLPQFAESVAADLEEAGADPDGLVLEVRERLLADGACRASVAALSRAGIEVLVENAGGGGVSLAELASFSVGGLKLGISLVSRIREDDPRGVEVARSLVLLAHGLGWRSLAVGVATEHQRSVLFGFGLDALQGEVVAMPMAFEELTTWIDRRRAR